MNRRELLRLPAGAVVVSGSPLSFGDKQSRRWYFNHWSDNDVAMIEPRTVIVTAGVWAFDAAIYAPGFPRNTLVFNYMVAPTGDPRNRPQPVSVTEMATRCTAFNPSIVVVVADPLIGDEFEAA